MGVLFLAELQKPLVQATRRKFGASTSVYAVRHKHRRFIRVGFGEGLFEVLGKLSRFRVRLIAEAFPPRIENERSERAYYDTCLFAIDLERTAIEYLEPMASLNDGRRSEIAQVLANEHQSVCESLWGRINYGQEVTLDPNMELGHGAYGELPEGMRQTFGEQFKKARQHADEADALALSIGLEEVHRLRAEGAITKQQAHELRESVYLMQMTLGAE